MAVLMLEIKEVKDQLINIHMDYNLNKIYLTSDICYAIAHLATKFEGIQYYCKKVYGTDGVYVTLMKKCNYECIPQAFLSESCMKEYFSENSKIFIKSDEGSLFDVNSLSISTYLNSFFCLLNMCRKECRSFLVDQDMINECVDKVLGMDESKIKVNKKQYR